MHLREPFPLRSYLGLSLLGLGCGFVGAMSGARIASDLTHASVSVPVIAVAPALEPIEVATTMSKHTDAQPPISDKPGFVIDVEGSSWFVLDIDPATIESHAKSKLEGEDPTTTIAALRDRDLTTALRAWRGESVVVDSKCVDVIHDFALVHVLSGDPVYAAEDTVPTARWTRQLIDRHGTAYVVAKLEHCTGTYARSALAPAIVAYENVDDPTKVDVDVAHATDDLMKSDVAEQVKQELSGQMADEHDEHDPTLAFDRFTEISTKAEIDPRTHTKWVVVHAHADFSCGGPQINFWGLYRVEGDRVVAVKQAKLEGLAQITGLLDIDGDGIPEILGTGWISPTKAIYDLEEATLVSYDVPFFGCPC